MSVELKSIQQRHSQTNSGFTADDNEIPVSSEDLTLNMTDADGDVGLQSEKDTEDGNCCSKLAFTVQKGIEDYYKKHRYVLHMAIKILIVFLYFAYFAYAMYYNFGDEGSYRLLVCTVIAVLLGIGSILLRFCRGNIDSMWHNSLKSTLHSTGFQKVANVSTVLLKICVFCAIAGIIIADVLIDYPQNLISVAGLAIYIVIFFVSSKNPARVNWHPVFWGFALQYIFALLILRTIWGYQAFKWIGDRVAEFLVHADEGAIFLFGAGLEEHFFAFKVLPIVVFFYSVISVLYYFGIMQFIVRSLGRFLAFCMGTAPTESLNAAGNIFVGMTEAPLMIEPFLKDMTKSEIHAVMTGGFATISGSVLGAFISFGIPANHLISASVMSAPAALAISKLSYPETGVSKSSSKDFFKMGKS